MVCVGVCLSTHRKNLVNTSRSDESHDFLCRSHAQLFCEVHRKFVFVWVRNVPRDATQNLSVFRPPLRGGSILCTPEGGGGSRDPPLPGPPPPRGGGGVGGKNALPLKTISGVKFFSPCQIFFVIFIIFNYTSPWSHPCQWYKYIKYSGWAYLYKNKALLF